MAREKSNRTRTRTRKSKRKAMPAKRGLKSSVALFLKRILLRLGLLAGVVVLAYGAWLDIVIRGQFEGRRWQLPARIYARPLQLYPGATISAKEIVALLQALHYRPGLGRTASYQIQAGKIKIRTREFQFWDGPEPARRLSLSFTGQRLTSIRRSGKPVSLVRLEPQLIGRIYPNHNEDRILVRLGDVSPLLINALLAVEDRHYLSHHGVSVQGMARAVWANIRAGRTVQGGSTLTQQLAKSYFLTNERSLIRKLSDVMIAVLLEFHYSKRELLQAYLNEVYLGQNGNRSINGFGLAARFYFGRHLNELNVPEMALLVGLVKGPSYFSPRRQPQRALQRRNLVLRIMAEQGVIESSMAIRMRKTGLGVTSKAPLSNTPYPAYLDLVRRQLQRDYRSEDLQSEGLRIFTTLDPRIQNVAQSAIKSRLSQLEKSRKLPKGKLQGAIVVTDTHTGEVRALTGGRESRNNSFNRALDAKRPIGSLIKPFVYLSALQNPQQYQLTSPLNDGPVRLKSASGRIWAPKNYDGKSHGQVSLISALAHSYNQATVHLGMQVGISKILDNLKAAGLTQSINPYPSVLLGAIDLSPLQVSGMYQTLATGGYRQALRTIRNVTDSVGTSLVRYPLTIDSALDSKATYLTLRAMQEVMRTGTARSASRQLPAAVTMAGKTGTTDDLRDSWFAGFGANHLTVTWIGRDDNQNAHLTGASGALRLWLDVMSRLRPKALNLPSPVGIRWAKVSATAFQRGTKHLSGCASGPLSLPYSDNGNFPPGCGNGVNVADTDSRQHPVSSHGDLAVDNLENLR